MVEEAYVSFETAKLLNGKGFDENLPQGLLEEEKGKA